VLPHAFHNGDIVFQKIDAEIRRRGPANSNLISETA
jgi:hypothetical protein